MARLIPGPQGSTPPNDFERLVVETFLQRLPDDYHILPNFVIKPATNPHAFEIDLVVLAPHALYVIECKEWYGRITGDDTEWRINDRNPKPRPMELTDLKCKVLKTHLGLAAKSVQVAPVMVICNGSQVLVGGGWASRLNTVDAAVKFLQRPHEVGAMSAPITPLHRTFIETIQGAWGKRLRAPLKSVRNFDLLELLEAEPGLETWRASWSAMNDPTPYRLRLWTVPASASPEERKRRVELIERPTRAVQRIGSHPNLLRVHDFGEFPDQGRFFEVTEWSEYGTLHGCLRNEAIGPLTVRERLEIAAGVASGLVAVHEKQVVHRNVCPETILVGPDRRPKLTDFDRAYVDRPGAGTVFAEVKHRNPAYVPPELMDASNYDFGPESDTYALGVLIYELLVGQPPFANPKAAADAEGVPPKLPSDVRAGVPGEVDTLVLDLLNVDDFHMRPSAEAALEILGKVLGSSTSGPRPESVKPAGELSFEPGNIIGGEYRVEGTLGEGSFAIAYKVQHLLQGKMYAMKVVKNPDDADLALQEWRHGESLPPHPNIATIIWLNQLPDKRPYVLAELVEGEDLKAYCEGTKTLPLSEVKRIGIKLLDALEALHPKSARIAALSGKTLTDVEAEELERLRTSGLLHRDIKPSNILLDRRNEPKLIDFNIATPAHAAQGKAGTPRYWAPDRGHGRPSEDLFSLGVVLYELATQHHPFQNNDPTCGTPIPPEAVPGCRLSHEFAEFLLRAVQPLHDNRFATATAMRAALEAVQTLHRAEDPAGAGDGFREFEPTPGESDLRDYNPYVTRLLTLYSQARHSNSGTRGLDEIANLTYVQTLLDTALAPDVLDGKFKLVIVTGNAGDGKTAFLQKLEAEFRAKGADVETLNTGNGATWIHDGVLYESNYDGSQDEGDADNDKVLERFFEPFRGKSLAGLSGNEARIIAINEGRLRDFLDHSAVRHQFEGLRSAVTGLFTENKDPPAGLLILNLNLRAVAAGGAKALVERQLVALLRPDVWAACDACAHRERCPLLANARTLSDPASGGAVRERVRRLFEIVHLRRQQHVTMRDLRSALSWLVLRDTGCHDIAKVLASPAPEERLARLSYTQAFARDTAHGGDRLVQLLRDVDIGEVETPDLDRRLHADAETAVPRMVFETRSALNDSAFKSLARSTPGPQDSADVGMVVRRQRELIRMLRRRAWFERRDGDWMATLPYRSLPLIERVISPVDDADRREARRELKDHLIEAISLLEGVRHPTVRQASICLRASRVKGATALSFRMFDAARFDLVVEQRTVASNYLEMEPDAVSLRSTDAGTGKAQLRLTLDLVEMLEMVRHGFRPNSNDMGGLFVNLTIFRNALLHLPYTSVLVTLDDETFHEVSAVTTPQGQLALRIQSQAQTTSRGA